MRDYTCSEIGLLTGMAVGGIFGAIGFSITNNALYFILTGIMIATGISVGSVLDKKRLNKK